MNRQMADIACILRKSVKKINPESIFSVYSGYQSDYTKWHYGVDWSMLAGKIDVAACGYGRPVKDLNATKAALKNTPLMLGAIAYPYRVKERFYPTYCSKAKLLRRACDSTKGILIYSYESLDGKTFYALAEISRLLADHENIFLKNQKTPGFASCKGLASNEIEVLSDGNKHLIMLMNLGSKPKDFELTNLASPENRKVKDYYRGCDLTGQKSIKGSIAPGDVKVLCVE